jgi:hypothetical protein
VLDATTSCHLDSHEHVDSFACCPGVAWPAISLAGPRAPRFRKVTFCDHPKVGRAADVRNAPLMRVGNCECVETR